MSPIYTPLNDIDLEVEQEPKTWRAGFKARQHPLKEWATPIIILLLLITNIATLLYSSTKDIPEAEPVPTDYGKLPTHNREIDFLVSD